MAVLAMPVDKAIAALEEHRFVGRCIQEVLDQQVWSGDVLRGVLSHQNGHFLATLRVIDVDMVGHRVHYEMIVREARGSSLGVLRIAATLAAEGRSTTLTLTPALSVAGNHTQVLEEVATRAVVVFAERAAALTREPAPQKIGEAGAAVSAEATEATVISSQILDRLASRSRRARLVAAVTGVVLFAVLTVLRQRRSHLSSCPHALHEVP